jgi:hypothetical protein
MEVTGELVVTGCDTAPVFEAAECPLDCVAEAVGGAVEGMMAFSGRIVWDDRLCSSSDQRGAQGIAVISGVGQAEHRCEAVHQLGGDRRIASVAGPDD